jgi:hypothetical protein
MVTAAVGKRQTHSFKTEETHTCTRFAVTEQSSTWMLRPSGVRERMNVLDIRDIPNVILSCWSEHVFRGR